MSIPESQKAADKPIGFLLWDNGPNVVIADIDLIIRPEDVNIHDPSRNKNSQTLGSTWLDSWGRGIIKIRISGTTGWRGDGVKDGYAYFQEVKKTVYTLWHESRESKISNGSNPDDIQLVYVDQLNKLAVVVEPTSFDLKRNKKSPLIAKYEIAMTVLGSIGDFIDDEKDSIAEAINNPKQRFYDAQSNLAGVSSDQTSMVDTLKATGSAIADTAEVFVNKSNELLAKIDDLADSAINPVVTLSANIQRIGHNAFQLLATPYRLADQVKAALMEISSNFNDAYCSIVNGFGVLQTFPDFSDMFGASNCSSTGGGTPKSKYADINPFEELYNLEQSDISVSPLAKDAMAQLYIDPLTSTFSESEILDRLGIIAEGIVIKQ